MKNVKYILLWILINIVVFGLFIYENSILVYTGEQSVILTISIITYWIISVSGVILGASLYIMDALNMPVHFFRGKENRKNIPGVVDVDVNAISSFLKPEVSIRFDQAYALMVMCIMVYFDYTWLTLFYGAHIVSLVIIRTISLKLKLRGDIYLEEQENRRNLLDRITPRDT